MPISPLDPSDPEAAIAAAAKRCSNWGRWGADDVHGTLNHLTDARRQAGAALIRRGESFSLAQSFDANGPQKGWRRRTNPVRTIGSRGSSSSSVALTTAATLRPSGRRPPVSSDRSGTSLAAISGRYFVFCALLLTGHFDSRWVPALSLLLTLTSERMGGVVGGLINSWVLLVEILR